MMSRLCAELDYKGHTILCDHDRLGMILVETSERGCWISCVSIQQAHEVIDRYISTGFWFPIH